MTADVELLPLPEMEQLANPFAHAFGSVTAYGHTDETLTSYARANVSRATAPLQAENERLRAEVDGWKAQHSRDSAELRRLCQHRDEYKACAERLAEALREAQPFIGWTGSYPELHAKIDALLRERLSALDSPAPTEAEVLAAAKRAAAANSSIHEGYDLELFWRLLDERAQAHWLKVARAALGAG